LLLSKLSLFKPQQSNINMHVVVWVIAIKSFACSPNVTIHYINCWPLLLLNVLKHVIYKIICKQQLMDMIGFYRRINMHKSSQSCRFVCHDRSWCNIMLRKIQPCMFLYICNHCSLRGLSHTWTRWLHMVQNYYNYLILYNKSQ